MVPKKTRSSIRVKCIVLAILSLLTLSTGKSRWSSLQFIPHADVLRSGTFLLDGHFFGTFDNISDGTSSFSADFGFADRVNLNLGYVNGFTMGFKALLLSESTTFMPSITLGMQNLFTNKENSYFGHENDSLNNELFFALAKSVEPLRVRFHTGLQMAPFSSVDKFNPFVGIEKYFGGGVYATLEMNRRDQHNCISLFSSLRVLKGSLEISVGVIDLLQMIQESERETFVQPGLMVGLKFRGSTRIGSMKGLEGFEDRLNRQNSTIESMKLQIDSLKSFLDLHAGRFEKMNSSVLRLTDSIETDEARMSLFVMEKLTSLKILYEQEPFEPEQVNSALREIVSYRDKIVPYLMDNALNIKNEHKIRTLSVSILGAIGNRSASDVLLEILGKSQDPEIRIEALIALGKLKETRAGYLMQSLTSDPNDAVAFTAAEVLRNLERETGIEFRNIYQNTTEISRDPPASLTIENENESEDLFEEFSELDIKDSDTGATDSAPEQINSSAQPPQTQAEESSAVSQIEKEEHQQEEVPVSEKEAASKKPQDW